MTYKEHIFTVCENTDLDDKYDVVETMQYLAKELMDYQDLCLRQEEKLKELMTAKDFEEWGTAEAKRMFKNHINQMEDSEYKTFCIEHFDEITGGNNA